MARKRKKKPVSNCQFPFIHFFCIFFITTGGGGEIPMARQLTCIPPLIGFDHGRRYWVVVVDADSIGVNAIDDIDVVAAAAAVAVDDIDVAAADVAASALFAEGDMPVANRANQIRWLG